MTDVLLRQEIEKLGGNEEDFKLVKDIEDPEDEEWNPKTTTDQSDDFNLEEFKKFHTSLNFDSVPKVISKPKNSENVKEEPEDGDEDREDEDEEETDMKVEVDSEPVGGLGLVPKRTAAKSDADLCTVCCTRVHFGPPFSGPMSTRGSSAERMRKDSTGK